MKLIGFISLLLFSSLSVACELNAIGRQMASLSNYQVSELTDRGIISERFELASRFSVKVEQYYCGQQVNLVVDWQGKTELADELNLLAAEMLALDDEAQYFLISELFQALFELEARSAQLLNYATPKRVIIAREGLDFIVSISKNDSEYSLLVTSLPIW